MEFMKFKMNKKTVIIASSAAAALIIIVVTAVLINANNSKSLQTSVDPNTITATASPQIDSNTLTPTPAVSEVTPSPTPEPGEESTPPPKKEVTVNDPKNNKILQEAPKTVEDRVVTSSVAKSVPIPEGFPLNYLNIIQGAQITDASKSQENGAVKFKLVQKVNIAPEDAFKFYNDLFSASHSYKIESSETGVKIVVTRAKSGLSAELDFQADSEGSIVTINAAVSE